MSESNLVERIVEANKAYQTKNNEQLAYWCKLFPDISYSAKELYGAIVKNVQAQMVPALEPGLVLIRQGGPFSPERLYLQMRRERLVFEICGAPFGTGFFVSSRLFDRRKEPTLLDFCVLFFLILLLPLPVIVLQLGWVWSVITVTGVLAFVWTIMRFAAMGILGGADRVLSDLPFIGPFYDRFFHPDTYYRQDINGSYREAVHSALMQAIDEMTKQKGLKALNDDERRPTIRDLHRK